MKKHKKQGVLGNQSPFLLDSILAVFRRFCTFFAGEMAPK
jgi:hypothetical protein